MSSQSTNVNAGGNQTVVVSSPGTFINRPTTLNTQAETFTYKVKIINPVKKSENIIIGF